MTPLRLATALSLAAAGTAQAADFNALKLLNQTEFRAFSEDVASAISYKGMIPAEGLGITGFDLGVRATATEVSNRDVLVKAASGASVPKSVPTVGLHAVKGLPFDIDVGLTLMTLPGTNIRATGGEVRWAFVSGNTLLPALAVRLSTVGLSGVDELKMRSTGVDLSISKGFLFATPYAGVGRVNVSSKAPGAGLKDESFGQSKVFAGVNIAFVPLALGLEVDKTGDATSYGIKLAIRW
jgi:hypothetical protein